MLAQNRKWNTYSLGRQGEAQLFLLPGIFSKERIIMLRKFLSKGVLYIAIYFRNMSLKKETAKYAQVPKLYSI